ncbi:hypothetical protein ACFSND_31290 [Brevibacillus brevis]|uniref:hypothetical protein n=1 Tax=Brevibacillus brevis TaxID=1393 RepID=UPI00362ECE20
MTQMDRELGWDDEIQKDGGEFIVLPDGDYNFTVTKFERGSVRGQRENAAMQSGETGTKDPFSRTW